MGRVSDKNAYQIKNTFVEIADAAEATDNGEFSRAGQRTMSDTGAQRPGESPVTPGFMPQTPSPFLAAQPDPCMMPYPMLDQSQLGGGCALPGLAFGDFGAEDICTQGYNCGDIAGQFGPSFQYDPNTGAYYACEYAFMPYDANCQYMVGQEQMQIIGDERSAEEHTKVLLNALSEKIGEDQVQVSGDGCLEQSNALSLGNGNAEDINGELAEWDNTWEDGSWGHNGNYGNYSNVEDQQVSQQPQQSSARRKSERREAREAARRQERAAAAAAISNEGYAGEEDVNGQGAAQWGSQAAQNKQNPGCVTTVMFRNIPNKYTREMLVNQLDQDMKGLFDFIYLPIDFKNKCNVGYAFINFRTVEACDTFVNRFNGVEVRKCLPGLNSRKVTEVTPARVQGFEENVQRLRNSPVMRELVHKPEWMPLIFDYNGLQIPFPAPERPLEPIKPRRRARDEEARLL